MNQTTNLTNALAARIAKTENIHFLRARNRVALAIRVAEAATRVGESLLTPVSGATIIEWVTVTDTARRLLVAEIGRPLPSESTLRLAREIAA